MQKIFKFLTIFSFFTLTTGFVYAAPIKSTPHTHDTVTALDGNWQVTLTSLYEHATFLNSDNQTITAFPLKASQTVTYGFVLPPLANFNITYAITAVQQTSTENKEKQGKRPR